MSRPALLRYLCEIDWTVFHLLNGALRGHPVVADQIEDFVTLWAVPLFALATGALWFGDRPGHGYRWKVACLAGLASAGLGLLMSQAVGHLWFRERPYVAHPGQTLLLTPPSHDPSFPSDHAVAAFAIAFSVVFLGGRRMGAFFLATASLVAVTRIFVGLHYPGDVAGGAILGLIAALIVFLAGRGRWAPVVATLSRLSDPLLRPAWQAFEERRRVRRST